MPSQTAKTPQKRTTVAELRLIVAEQATEAQFLKESMSTLQLELEDRGWRREGNEYSANGLRLDTIKKVSDDLRSWVVGGGIMKRLSELRGNYIYGDGVGFANYKRAQTVMESSNNATKLFSVQALQEINRAHGTDGVVVFLVNKATKEIVRFGLQEMGQPWLDGDDAERTWYVRRSYTRYTPSKPEGESRTVYYVADTCPTAEAGRISVKEQGGELIDVDQRYTAVVWDVNRQVSWPLGIPDLLASLQWAEKYTGYLKNQDRFAEALAMLAWEYKSATVTQAKAVGAIIANGQGVAGSANHTSNTELKALPGGSTVSFDNGAPLAAQAAAAAEVPTDSLLAKSQSAAAQTMDPDVKKMAAARRLSATAFFKRIGKLLGAPNLEVVWPDLETESPFREAQMIIAGFNTGTFTPDEIRRPLAQRIRIPLEEGSTAPEGVLVPNTKEAAEFTAALTAASTANDGTSTATGNGTNSQGQDALGVGDTGIDNTARDNGEVGS